MLGKLSIAGAVAAILMIPTALSAQVGGAVNRTPPLPRLLLIMGVWSRRSSRCRKATEPISDSRLSEDRHPSQGELFCRPDIRWANGTVMNTKLARSVVPTVEICPNCKRIAEVTPVLFADGLQDVTYKCKGCRLEMKRTFKRRLGAWQLIRYTPKFAALPRYR